MGCSSSISDFSIDDPENIRVLIIVGSKLESKNPQKQVFKENAADYCVALFIRQLFIDKCDLPSSHILTTCSVFDYFDITSFHGTPPLKYSQLSMNDNCFDKDMIFVSGHTTKFNHSNYFSNNDKTVKVEIDQKEITFQTEKPISEIFQPFDASHIFRFIKDQNISSRNSKLFVFILDNNQSKHRRKFRAKDFIHYIDRIQLIPNDHVYLFCSSPKSYNLINYVKFTELLLDEKLCKILKPATSSSDVWKICNFILHLPEVNSDDINSTVSQYVSRRYYGHSKRNTSHIKNILLSHTKEEYEELYSILQKLKIIKISNKFLEYSNLTAVQKFSQSAEIICSSSIDTFSYRTPLHTISPNDTKFQSNGVIFLSALIEALFFQPTFKYTSNELVCSIQNVFQQYDSDISYHSIYKDIYQTSNESLNDIQNFFDSWLNHPDQCTFIHPNHEWPSINNQNVIYESRTIQQEEYCLDINNYIQQQFKRNEESSSSFDDSSFDLSYYEYFDEESSSYKYKYEKDDAYIPYNTRFKEEFIQLYNEHCGNIPKIDIHELYQPTSSDFKEGWRKIGIIEKEIRYHFCLNVSDQIHQNYRLFQRYFDRYLSYWDEIHPLILKTTKLLVKKYKTQKQNSHETKN